MHSPLSNVPTFLRSLTENTYAVPEISLQDEPIIVERRTQSHSPTERGFIRKVFDDTSQVGTPKPEKPEESSK